MNGRSATIARHSLEGGGKVSISTSESSSSLDRRAEESVRFDRTGVDEEEEGGEMISTECCRRIGRSGRKALDEWLELTSKLVLVLVDDEEEGEGVEYERREFNALNAAADDVGTCMFGR